MGGHSSTVAITELDTTDIIEIQERLGKKYAVSLDVQVAHYTPSIFPLVPIINPQINKLCVDSWKLIYSKKEMTDSGLELTGITLFYNDFYERLKLVDENRKIESVLSAHSTGLNKIAEKGAIIIRIINYALSITKNDEQTQFRLYNLGKAHTKRAIRPYMYSIFIQNLLYTIANQLGVYATHEVMEAWVNVFSFIMKSMLPLAIKGQTLDTEIGINTKSEFSSDTMKAQVQEIKYERDKALSSVRSHTTNRSNIHRQGLIESREHSTNNSIHTRYEAPNSSGDRRSPSAPLPDSQNTVGINNIFIPKLPLLRSIKSDEENISPP
jgi:hemoglobin-like flavoprotein